MRGSVEHGVQALTGEAIGAQHLNNQSFSKMQRILNFARGLDDGAYPECLEQKKWDSDSAKQC